METKLDERHVLFMLEFKEKPDDLRLPASLWLVDEGLKLACKISLVMLEERHEVRLELIDDRVPMDTVLTRR